MEPASKPPRPRLPSNACSLNPPVGVYIHQKTCHDDKGASDVSRTYQHPGRPLPRPPESPALPDDGHTPGMGFGAILMPYCVDWGDTVGIIRRKKAHATIFHAWPRAADRNFALKHVTDFAAPSDKYHPPFILYLITAPPFAGWRWFPEAALRWLEYAQTIAGTLGEPRTLTPANAVQTGSAWCDAVRALWEDSTVEHFPYDGKDLANFWTIPDHAATLP